jgi:tetratricopeptide (TPR) repeat protein
MFEKAFEISHEVRAIAEETQRPYDLSYAHLAEGLAFLLQGNPQLAILELEQALQCARLAEITLLVPSIARYLGRAYALTGRFDDAFQLLEEALAHTKTNSLIGLHAWCSAAFALSHLRSKGEDCHERLSTVLDMSRHHGYRPAEAHAMRLIGLHHAAKGEADKAERSYREAIALADHLGMRPEKADALRNLAGLLIEISRSAEAKATASTAYDLYLAMGMAEAAQEIRHTFPLS